jgi:hypothetical protein
LHPSHQTLNVCELMHRILAKLPVLWLVVLIVLPCTAPFSTCDLFDLLPHRDHHSTTLHRGSGPDHALPHAPALRVAAPRTRLPRLSSRPAAFATPSSRPVLQRSLHRFGSTAAPSGLRRVLRI